MHTQQCNAASSRLRCLVLTYFHIRAEAGKGTILADTLF